MIKSCTMAYTEIEGMDDRETLYGCLEDTILVVSISMQQKFNPFITII